MAPAGDILPSRSIPLPRRIRVRIPIPILIPVPTLVLRNLSLLKPCRGPGQGDGPRRPENIGRRIAIRRPEIDRDVNFAKKNPSFVKMNTESINLTENPSDFVEPYFTKKPP